MQMSPIVDLRAPRAVGGEVDANALMATLAAGGLYPVDSMAALIDESALAIRLGHLGCPPLWAAAQFAYNQAPVCLSLTAGALPGGVYRER